MKNFKQLGIATAVAAVSASYVGLAQAQTVTFPNNNLGDVAIVPYYTVQGDWTTGVHIINTGSLTEVVKIRLRRASDSMDALDINIILSPKDEWVGNIDDATGTITLTSDDKSCTAPLEPYYSAGAWPMQALYSAGAEEGYIEIISMGSAPVTSPIGVASKHGSTGIPANCGAVESNFFRVAGAPTSTPTSKGVHNSALSGQTCTDDVLAGIVGPASQGCVLQPDIPGVFDSSTQLLLNSYAQGGNALKVAYHIRDTASGLEFGGNAVHLADFSSVPMMSNQEIQTIGVPDPFGYFFPDLNGGSPSDPITAAARATTFEGVRSVLGARSVINDWSVAAARNVSTDWVITLPGQYTMLNLGAYTTSLFDPTAPCLTQGAQAAVNTAATTTEVAQSCDWRDLPVTVATRDIWDREEQTFVNPTGGLVISPAVGNQPGTTKLENEVNVIEWTAGENAPVLDSVYAQSFDVSALGSDFGWAELGVTSDSGKAQGIYTFAPLADGTAVCPQPSATPGADTCDPFTPTSSAVPIVGFVAWERSFPSDPSANYGRLVDHSYGS